MSVAQFDHLTDDFLSALSIGGGGISALADACVRVLPVCRAAILMRECDAGLQPWCASDGVAVLVETVQTTLGQGPAVEAVTQGVPVLLADLAASGERWPGFAAELARIERIGHPRISGPMVAVPLHLGAVRLGALDLYGEHPGLPRPAMISAGLHIADLVTAQLVAGAVQPGDGVPRWRDQPLTSGVIHQAAGMVIGQLGIRAADAYARLRAYAFAHGMSLAEVAESVVANRIRFDADAD
ncbi:GAF and ANTAR domain-containing protein [Nocardia sp. NBC_01009]|uniref:GAF and ANTAR domain-containing protein n=1 Tax=Nocardia sp. NBC_01009 TaxID=2975996 RepID=UPI00386533A3|nr:GAF and ANTAR domain-containing protein [Nocardia sp. NBC_01009]